MTNENVRVKMKKWTRNPVTFHPVLGTLDRDQIYTMSRAVAAPFIASGLLEKIYPVTRRRYNQKY